MTKAQRDTARYIQSLQNRTQIFIQIIDLIYDLNDARLRIVAEDAKVHWTTPYAWKSGKTFSPRLDTVTRVALSLGYELKLVKGKGRVLKPPMRVVK